MTATPAAALAVCDRSRLLRPICPRRVPFGLDPRGYSLIDGCANAPYLTIVSSRCTRPDWSYEVLAPIPGQTAPSTVTAWDGSRWFVPAYAPLNPPPYQVHVDIQARPGGASVALAGPSVIGARPAGRITDALLNPARTRPAWLGRVRWSGQMGTLVLAPTNANAGGPEAGHLIFAFRRHHTDYDISLHAWTSMERIRSRGQTHTLAAPQPGPALPHIIATLKTIVESALTP